MVNELFVIMGIMIMAISAVICGGIIVKVKEKISWLAVFVLITFFLAGYTVYFIINFKNIFDLYAGDFLESQILFWGSVFVILVLFVSRQMLDYLESTISDLQELTKKYETQKQSLVEMGEKLNEKNLKLEEIIGEFYDYHLGENQKDLDPKTNALKEKIDKLKFNNK